MDPSDAIEKLKSLFTSRRIIMPDHLWNQIANDFVIPLFGEDYYDKGICSGWADPQPDLKGLNHVYKLVGDDQKEEFLRLCLDFMLDSQRYLVKEKQNTSHWDEDIDLIRALLDTLP